MKRYWLLLLTLGIGPACQLVCDSNSCGCGTPKSGGGPGYYDIEGVSLAALNGNWPSGAVVTTGSTVPVALLQLRLAPLTRHFSSRGQRPGGAGVAWACSPATPEFVEELDSVLVRSRHPYDARHPAGTSLNDLLVAGESFQEVPLEEYLQQRAGRPAEYLPLRLRVPPAAAGPQQLVVRYRLRNGEVYTAETPVFDLQP